MKREIDFLKTVFKNSCSSFSFHSTEGELLLVETQKGSDFLSTVQTARFVTKYFPLENGDWVAVNDPQSGGYNPFGISFVGRIGNLIWSVRVPEKNAPWNSTDKWESLGFRLPPMPYKVKGELNSHVPEMFLKKVESFEKKITADFEKLKKFVQWKASSFAAPALKKYFEVSKQTLAQKLKDTPWAESHHKSKTPAGETLSSTVSISQNSFAVDLTGSTASLSWGLTEPMTESVVNFACVQALGCQSFYNHGTEKFFQIVKPRSSWLSVKEPASPAQVHFLSFPFVEAHLKQLLAKMKFENSIPEASVDGWMQFQFSPDNCVTTDDLQKNWGRNVSGVKLLRTEDNSLVFELVSPCRLFRVEAGTLEMHELKSGAQFQLSLI